MPDPHIESVTNILKQIGADVRFFDVYNPAQYAINMNFSDKDLDIHAYIDNVKLRLSEFHAVWWRVKPSFLFSRTSKKRTLWSEFAHREWESILESLHSFTPKARWINPRLSDLCARNKPTQLLVAKELGFHIPTTLISNDPSNIRDFLSYDKKNAVYKVLTWYFEYPDKIIFTSKVTLDQVLKSTASIRVSPGIFQEQIEKSYEIRVTTVGEKIFSARLDSQIYEDTRLDWRRNQLKIPYSKYKLPKEIAKQIRKMNNQLGLIYAAYDFIVTPKEEYYFLEVNPLGQWLWIENKLGLPISKALAEALVS